MIEPNDAVEALQIMQSFQKLTIGFSKRMDAIGKMSMDDQIPAALELVAELEPLATRAKTLHAKLTGPKPKA